MQRMNEIVKSESTQSQITQREYIQFVLPITDLLPFFPLPIWKIIYKYFDGEKLLFCVLLEALNPICVDNQVFDVFYDRETVNDAKKAGEIIYFSETRHEEENFLREFAELILSSQQNLELSIDSLNKNNILERMSKYKDINFVQAMDIAIAESKNKNQKFLNLLPILEEFVKVPIVKTKPAYQSAGIVEADGDAFIIDNAEFQKILDSFLGLYILGNIIRVTQAYNYTDRTLLNFLNGTGELVKTIPIVYGDIFYHFHRLISVHTHLNNNKQWLHALGLAKEQSYSDRILRLMSITFIIYRESLLNPVWHARLERILFEYIPMLAETDIAFRSKRNNSAKTFILAASALLSFGVIQYQQIQQQNPNFEWGIDLISFVCMAFPRLVLGAEEVLAKIQRELNRRNNREHSSGEKRPLLSHTSLHFFRDDIGNFKYPAHLILLPLVFAFRNVIDNPIMVPVSFFYYFISTWSLSGQDLWTPWQLRSPNQQYRIYNQDEFKQKAASNSESKIEEINLEMKLEEAINKIRRYSNYYRYGLLLRSFCYLNIPLSYLYSYLLELYPEKDTSMAMPLIESINLFCGMLIFLQFKSPSCYPSMQELFGLEEYKDFARLINAVGRHDYTRFTRAIDFKSMLEQQLEKIKNDPVRQRLMHVSIEEKPKQGCCHRFFGTIKKIPEKVVSIYAVTFGCW